MTTNNRFSEAKNGAALPDHIYMDAMGFGMGCCCLQLTFQACNVGDARRLYDAFVPLGPIMVTQFPMYKLMSLLSICHIARLNCCQSSVSRLYIRRRL